MEQSSLPFTGKIALVTGGSRGIGAAIVRRLANDGALVAFTYASSPDKANDVVAAVEAAGGKAVAILADSADADAVALAIEHTVQRFGGLDILVSNAGILLRGAVDDFSLEDFDRMIAINVRAPFVAIKAASKHLRPGGRVITIGSVVAERSAFPGASVYSTTKSALVGMVRGLAIDFAPRGITVNNVQPGPTATDMNPADGEHVDMLKALLPIGRLGTGEEIADMVAYLASPGAAFVTGSSLTIDGGYLA